MEREPLLVSARRSAPRRLAGASLALAAIAFASLRARARDEPAEALAAASARAPPARFALRVSNAYERELGVPIGDGWYPFEHLVEVGQPTRLELSLATGSSSAAGGGGGSSSSSSSSSSFSSEPALDPDELFDWSAASGLALDAADPADAAASGADGAGVEHVLTFKRVGHHHVRAIRRRTGAVASFNVTSKYVRRELRDLTDADRDRYFEALHTVYATEQAEGVAKYGRNFKSAAWLVREHLYGAADKSCDHWHDDAGFLNHHVGITLQLEASLRSVDPHVCSHYWDYTVDAASEADGVDYVTSPIFDADWFGSADPNRTDHAISHGRWAFTHVMKDATGFSNITNPYGLLRSPWNTDPTPFVTRSRYVLGVKDAYYTLPECSDFQSYLKSDDDTGALTMASISDALNGELHGPVHIMTGGHWWLDPLVESLFHTQGHDHGRFSPDQMLLGSKYLWRQGYVRCPEYCSTDTPQSECACSCPAEIVGQRSAQDILMDMGIESIWSLMDQQIIEGVGLSYDELLELFCHVGHAGEMFTSAAPADPLFWPLHGLAERFVQLARLMGARGLLTLDETWGYSHEANILSDTHVVCDWSQVPAHSMLLPHCEKGATCPGHRADDVLPFERVLGEAGRDFYTNEQFYDAIAPWSGDLPYVYDKLTTWAGCTGGTILDMDGRR